MSSSSESNMAIAKTIIATIGSVAATAMVVRSIASEILPSEFQDYISVSVRNIFNKFSNQLTMVIDEFDGLDVNEVYEAAQIYLGSKISPTNTHRLKVSKPLKEKKFNVSMERNEEVVDFHNGQKYTWAWVCQQVGSRRSIYNPRDMNSTMRSEVRSFELTFHRKNKDIVLDSYLSHVINEAKLLKHENRTLKIHTVDHEMMHDLSEIWMPVNLDHPAKFETLAMDLEQKNKILKDLDRFVERKEYYRKVGKAWKRGYLLYGPPGTGKSSLIAAMANYLNFDIYDLELTEITKNSDLRRVLLATANNSILVVEDIDCTIDLHDKLGNREADDDSPSKDKGGNKITLSGLLNFIDGLWSSCGDQRIIIFTTNHIEKLDPALLRPGRMDMHIHMAYCTPSGFKLLAANYLGGITQHKLFEEIEELIGRTAVTPAEVAEQLIKEDEVEVSLKGLIDFLNTKKEEQEETTTEEDDKIKEEKG
ncbi:protein HYPER-SENSITIVITY-RELATED 4-like [Lycium ferocissimum]|uniref:protein HYPER-SENSITIVITY-RELATED 4-like n=1 Tax=Lycium ferocissimum TaxID=112874 RepID=UPI002814B421|nr:protein HYPER-SENSITIVITY-RELATED 4-like [Lycium ferocissimum]